MSENTAIATHKKDACRQLKTALYIRLSREDGDKAESFSIVNQRLLLEEYVNEKENLFLYNTYIDDGYTGTNFERPAFRRMITDIENKKVDCVIVKDLSRLGRNMSKVSEYINDYFPSRKVRFISINDNVDRQYYNLDFSEDMVIDIKNMFNGFYPKDISQKVRSTFRSKQGSGQFIGAFSSYGYLKSAADHNRLEIDPYAAEIVRRIYGLYLGGMGQNTIAKKLNDEGILCPSEYKKFCGLNYRNCNRLDTTVYWTYSTVHKILQNEMYTGDMVQNKSFRQMCKKKSSVLPRNEWIIVKGTHEPIIDRDTWNKVQELLKRNVRQTRLDQNIHIFAGFLKCGDCGRAMVKIVRKGSAVFNCGSYNRCGKSHCSIHSIAESDLERMVLDDLNLIVRSVKNISSLIQEEQNRHNSEMIHALGNADTFQAEIDRLEVKKEAAYEDYSDRVISKKDYLKYRFKYENQIEAARQKIKELEQLSKNSMIQGNPWIEQLLQGGRLEHLDRETVVEMISVIYVYEDRTVKIVYNFSDELELLLGKYGSIGI